MKRKLLQLVLLAYAAVGLIIGVPLMLLLGPAANVDNATSVQLLGAAAIAFAVGAVAAARDPERNRILVAVEIVFTGLSALVFAIYVFIHHSHVGFEKIRYLFLAASLVGLVLLLVTFPGTKQRGAGRD